MRIAVMSWAAGAALCLTACGAVRSTSGIVRAQAELTAAKTARAETHAPFEIVAAEAYLHKAREEQSYAELVRAVEFADKAWSCARVARLMAEARQTEESDDVRPEHFAGEAVCRPGPDRGVPLAHLEKAALGGARPSASPRAAPGDEPTDPVIAPPAPRPSPAPAPKRGPAVVAPPPVESPPPVVAPPPASDEPASPAPPPDGDSEDEEALPAGEPFDGALPPGDPLPEGDPVDEDEEFFE